MDETTEVSNEQGSATDNTGNAETASEATSASEATKPTDEVKGSKPTDAEAKLLKEVMDKKTALRKTQTDLEEVRAKLKDFDGLDAAEIRQLVEEKKALNTKKLEEKGEWDRLRAQMAEENKTIVSGVTEKLTAAEQRAQALSQQVAELTVGSAFAASTFIKDELTLPASKARALYGSHFSFSEEGKVVAYDKPVGSAERTVLVDSQGEPLMFEAALKKLVDADPDRDQITKSKVKPGAGSSTVTKAGTPAKTFDEPKGIDRIAAALRAAAGK